MFGWIGALKSIPAWVILAALLVLVCAFGYWRIDSLQSDNQRLKQSADVAMSALAYQVQLMDRTEAALQERSEQLQAAQVDLANAKRSFDQLEASDAQVRDWSSSPVPTGINDWLRDTVSGSDQADDPGATDNSPAPATN